MQAKLKLQTKRTNRLISHKPGKRQALTPAASCIRMHRKLTDSIAYVNFCIFLTIIQLIDAVRALQSSNNKQLMYLQSFCSDMYTSSSLQTFSKSYIYIWLDAIHHSKRKIELANSELWSTITVSKGRKNTNTTTTTSLQTKTICRSRSPTGLEELPHTNYNQS